MENYESPTIEAAEVSGIHLEPQLNIPVSITDVGLYLEIYLVAAVYTTAIVATTVVLAAVFYKTLATTT